MRVRISEPRLLPLLVESLTRGDCLTVPVDDSTCDVLHQEALDEREARLELVFFLRAWAGGYPDVRAELVA